MTTAQLWHHAQRAAAHLQSRGVLPGQVVIIAHPHDPLLYPAFLGAQLVGAIPAFMPFPSPKQDAARYWQSHRALFERLQPGAVIANEQYLEQFAASMPGETTVRVALATLTSTHDGRDTHNPGAVPPLPAGHPIALLQHSSGTTGNKKSVILTHDAILEQVAAYAERLQLPEHACIASWLPLYHDMGLIACFMLPLILGVPLVAIDPFAWSARPVMLLDAIAQFRATHCWLPNFAFQHLVRAVDPSWNGDLSSMTAFINCSEPCKPETARNFVTRFAPNGVTAEQVQVCYAMAETVFAVTQTGAGAVPTVRIVDRAQLQHTQRAVVPSPDAVSVELSSVGRPLPLLEVSVRSSSGATLPDSTVGEICVRGACLFDGYFRDPDPGRDIWFDEWYRTGDLGFLDAGELYVTGRRADLLIINGRNFYAHDIEAIVHAVPGVKEGRAVAIGVYHQDIGSEQLVVLSETSDDPAHAQHIDTLASRVRIAVMEGLGVAVTRFVPVPAGWLEKTTSGKVSRERNYQKYLTLTTAPLPSTTPPVSAHDRD